MVPLVGDQFQDISMPGVPGVAKIWTGTRGQPRNLITTQALGPYDSLELRLRRAKYEQGNLVTIIDDYGVTWYYLFVLQVEVAQVLPVASGIGAAAGAVGLILTEWVVEPTETAVL